MKMKASIAILAIAAATRWNAQAQIYESNITVQTFAGSGFSGLVNGTGQQTMFDEPLSLCSDAQSNLYVLDEQNEAIRLITPSASVSTYIGISATIYGTGPLLSFDGRGILLLANNYEDSIIDIPDAGTQDSIGLNGSGISGPYGICPDAANNWYISDRPGCRIFKRDTNGNITVYAGSGNAGYADGPGIFDAFYGPQSLAIDGAGNLYVWDSVNKLIRKIDQNQNVTTLAGKYQVSQDADGASTNASFRTVSQMCFDGFGNLILACGSSIRKISPSSNVTTLAGSFTVSGFSNAVGPNAQFNSATGVCVVGTNIFIADSGNQMIRVITSNAQPQPVSPANLQLNAYAGLKITGIIGRAYQIQSSPDMTNWTAMATLLLASSPYLWIDQNPVSGNKFYRALLLP